MKKILIVGLVVAASAVAAVFVSRNQSSTSKVATEIQEPQKAKVETEKKPPTNGKVSIEVSPNPKFKE